MQLAPLSRLRELMLAGKITPEELLAFAETLHTYERTELSKATQLLNAASRAKDKSAALDAAQAEVAKAEVAKAEVEAERPQDLKG
jgi:hypothetical protein